MAIKEIDDFLKELKHLPAPLKDFHDQKDLFKSFHEWMNAIHKDQHFKMPTWVEGHVYTIDYFLKFMAIHGWTLQRSRANVEFCDLDATIAERKEKEAQSLKDLLKK